MQKTIIVIGGGPGGYVAAIRAAQLGAKVHLIEKGNLGGTCLNVGCIPTKALLHTVELYEAVKSASPIGLKVEKCSIDWPSLQKHRQVVVDRLVNGVKGLLKANGVEVHQGEGVLKNKNTVSVVGAGSKELTADYIILALGSSPVKLNFPGSELPGVIYSAAALSLEKIPASMVIVGGGVIGIELAALYNSVGCKVTVVEMLPEILPPVDSELAVQVREELSQRGVAFMNEAKLTEAVRGQNGLIAKVEKAGKVHELEAEKILMAVGRRANSTGAGLEKLGIATERGRIKVNSFFATNIPNVYAIGDCNGELMLAHAASAQGVAAVEHALGHEPAYYRQTVPSCIYIQPEVAGVGMTEDELKKKNIPYKVGRFPLAGNGKSVIENNGKGQIKVLAGAKYEEILGVHMIGPRVTDLIAEAAMAIRLEATVDELISTVHAHPTVSEAVAEAALAVNNQAIHWPPTAR